MIDLESRPAYADNLSWRETGLCIRSLTAAGMVRLQWRPAPGVELSVLERTTGLNLPVAPDGPAGTDPAVFWCAPGEWLIAGRCADIPELKGALRSLAAELNIAVTDAGGLVGIELSGDRARERLERGCSADLAQTVSDHYVLTRLFGISAIVHKTGDSSAFHLYIDRSVAHYLWDCLTHH